MTEILFYHLERATLEQVLPGLLEKTLERGWKAQVRASSAERVKALDTMLWSYRDDAFLPHGCDGDGEGQPIWLTDGDDAPNGANVLFLVDGVMAAPETLTGYARCVTIFDGRDEGAIAAARSFWKEAKQADFDITYWQQSSAGRWEKKA